MMGREGISHCITQDHIQESKVSIARTKHGEAGSEHII